MTNRVVRHPERGEKNSPSPSDAPQMVKAAPLADELIPATPATAPVSNPVTPGVPAETLPEAPRDAVPEFGTDAASHPSSAQEAPQFTVPTEIGVRAAKAGRAAKALRRAVEEAGSDLRGRIVSVNESDASVRIKAPGESEETVLVPADTRIFVDNKAANLEDIQAGMGARIRLKDGQAAFAIHAHAPLMKIPVPRRVTGKPAKEAKKKKLKKPLSTL